MRGNSVIAAMILLAGCGSPAPESGPGNEAGLAGQSPGEANTAVPANPVVEASNTAAEADSGAVSACLMQGDERLQVKPFRAVGTEPFWAARVEGRCVTYSTPEDQQGVRVWTRYSDAAGGGTWIGQLGGKPFEMRTRAEPGCSDGMSDKIYPVAVELSVNGEQRRGCAEPIADSQGR